MTEVTTADYLSREQMANIGEVIDTAINTTLSIITKEKQREKVATFLLEVMMGDLYSFFTAPRLQKLAEEIFTDDAIRSFVLNVTERANLGICCIALNANEKLLELLVTSVRINKPSNKVWGEDIILMNTEVTDSLFVYENQLQKLLLANYWLVILYLAALNFRLSDSQLDATVTENKVGAL